MNKVRIKELDSLFVLRHAQRCDKVASTISSIGFTNSHSDGTSNEYTISDTYNPHLATFESTSNKSNNGYVQSMEMGSKILNYIQEHVEETIVILKFHTSPYLRCVETIKYIIDYISKKHRDDKLIKIELSIDQVLSEWLNTELDINYFPPNDNGASLLDTAIQYLNANLPFNKNENIKIFLKFNDSYQHGNPGPYSETFLQQFSRLSNGLISIIKDESKNLSKEANSKDIVLLMTHGACVRSLVSKLLGKSLFVEIPLASMSLAKPSFADSKHYYWRLIETDIELRSLSTFEQVDIYSNRDPFKDIQTTFSHTNATSQLNFKNEIPASKTDNFNRMRSHSLLNPKPKNSHDSDSDTDSENEGISFKARSRRESTSSGANNDTHRRFRSSSLFGPVMRTPFLNEGTMSFSRKQSRDRLTQNLLQPSSTTSTGLKRNTSFLSPSYNSGNLSRLNSTGDLNFTVSNESSTSKDTYYRYRNIDEDDGTHGFELVPDLTELSSNNSSTNSFHEVLTNKLLNTKLSSDDDELKKSSSSIITITGPDTKSQDIHTPTATASSSNEAGCSSNDHKNNESDNNNNNNNTKGTNGSRIFDKSLIEKSLNEIIEPASETNSMNSNYNKWLNFQQPHAKSEDDNKFKIDLYGKKNRFKLNLYDDDHDTESSGSGWFLGSNKY